MGRWSGKSNSTSFVVDSDSILEAGLIRLTNYPEVLPIVVVKLIKSVDA